jgi:YggT family protein
MLQVTHFLLETLFFVLIAASLLRAWMNYNRVSMSQQPGVFVMAITDWLVKPLRRLLPKSLMQSKVDAASLTAAALFALAFALIWSLVIGVWIGGTGFGFLSPFWPVSVLSLGLKTLIKVALQTTIILVIGFAILSWVQPGSSAYALLGRLTDPFLAPLRKVIPMVGGIDLSALALILALQIALMLLG